MTHRLAVNIADFLLCDGTIQKEDYDIYVYGYEILLDTVTQLAVLLVAGVVTHVFFETVVFLLVFSYIRKYSGGYHASTKCMCNIITYLVWGIVMHCSILFELSIMIKIVLCATVTVITYCRAPVEHPNKPIGEECVVYRKKALCRVMIVAFCSVVMHDGVPICSNIMCWTLTCIGVSILKKGGMNSENS